MLTTTSLVQFPLLIGRPVLYPEPPGLKTQKVDSTRYNLLYFSFKDVQNSLLKITLLITIGLSRYHCHINYHKISFPDLFMNKKQPKKNQKKQPNKDNDSEDEFLTQLIQQQQQHAKQQQIQPAPTEELTPSKGPAFTEGIPITHTKFSDNSALRKINDWQEAPWKQTQPPTVPIAHQFAPDHKYPRCSELSYNGDKSSRITSEEMREMDLIHEEQLQKLRKAAECHKQVRQYAQKDLLKPGRKLIDICESLEEMNRFLIQENGLQAGIGFPTGCSINFCAAHYTPNTGDNTVLQYDDVCKIDFGTHVDGWIIDSAFTVAFNPVYDTLLEAVKESTDVGVRTAGIDVRLGDIGAAIQETMESYEVELGGQVYRVKCMKNLLGHSIDRYKIHGGKSVPTVKSNDQTKMLEGELYAIETFGSTGKGYAYDDLTCSHYMKDFNAPDIRLKMPQARQLLQYIDKKYNTLAFCRRWLDRDGQNGYTLGLKNLCDLGIINPCPPLCDVRGSYVAQFEHTFFLKASCKEVLSRGDDY